MDGGNQTLSVLPNVEPSRNSSENIVTVEEEDKTFVSYVKYSFSAVFATPINQVPDFDSLTSLPKIYGCTIMILWSIRA